MASVEHSVVISSQTAKPPPEETGTITDVMTSAGRLKFKLIQVQWQSKARSAGRFMKLDRETGGNWIMELWRGQKRFSNWNHEFPCHKSYVELKPNSLQNLLQFPKVCLKRPQLCPTLFSLNYNTDVALSDLLILMMMLISTQRRRNANSFYN